MAETPVTGLPRGYAFTVRDGETLLDAARRAGVPLASSCAGRAICGDCVVRIVDGAEHADGPPAAEEAWRARTGRGDGVRLACCLRVDGPLSIATTYW